jgi:hypothetical protein
MQLYHADIAALLRIMNLAELPPVPSRPWDEGLLVWLGLPLLLIFSLARRAYFRSKS